MFACYMFAKRGCPCDMWTPLTIVSVLIARILPFSTHFMQHIFPAYEPYQFNPSAKCGETHNFYEKGEILKRLKIVAY
ncbi:hypothetical protein POVWA2_040310 [Plasmodium ovale wallikeri]|uniref:Uncharacterized protein n=1 Tax=Plasmodium ovale wallikeri TaxID=864142 RepID=A0A1A8ZA68_PLAOA|nr:hypothetical protein POVWA1_041750 [Plasmodium ovale wallikeri]SBT40701.1 hypothetical protein POVWA2_040310 [Plasmodium ovale wallikeri]